MAAETKLVVVRRSETMPFGVDLVDSRDGTVLAWARLHTGYVVAGRVNEAYADRDKAPDSAAMMAVVESLMDGGGREESAFARMLPARERLGFIEAMAELLGWVGQRVSVFVGCPGDAGAASFSATLTRVAPEFYDDSFLFLRFERNSDFVDLDPGAMTPYLVRDNVSGTSWIEFEVRGRRALSVRSCGEIDDPADTIGGDSR